MSVEAYNTRRLGPNRMRVHGKWIGYRGESRWHPIAAAFAETPDGFSWTRGPAQYHVGKHLHDGARVVADNRWDIFSRAPITAPAAEFELTPIGGFNVAGQFDPPSTLAANYPHVSFATDQSQVWHPEAGGPGLHVRWTIHHCRAPRMTRELVVDPQTCPQRDLSLSWDVRAPRVLALVRDQSGRLARPWTGSPGDAATVPTTGVSIVSIPDQAAADRIADELATGATATGLRRGSGIKPPLVWYWNSDGTLITAPATVTAEIQSDGETVRFTKTIPLAIIQAAAAENSYVVADDSATIYPDPDTESTSCDGYASAYSGSDMWWDWLRENPGVAANDTFASLTVQIEYGGFDWNNFVRSLVLFDTSSLSGATVTAATVGVTNSFALQSFGSALSLCASNPASATGLVAGDYDSLGATRLSDTDHALSGMGADEVQAFALNATGLAALDLDGISKFGLRIDYDLDNSEPIGSQFGLDFCALYSADQSGTANDPYLDVTYGAAAEEIDDTVVRRQQQLAR